MKQFFIKLFCRHEWKYIKDLDWWWSEYECEKCHKIKLTFKEK